MIKPFRQADVIPEWVYTNLKSRFPEYSEAITSENTAF